MAGKGRPKKNNKAGVPLEGNEDSGQSSSELSADLSQSLWAAASKFSSGGKKGERVESEKSELWTEKHILDFRDFCASPEHMNFPPLSPRQARIAEYMFGDDPKKIFENNRNMSVLSWGKGSGKDLICALMLLYIIYILLCTRSPQILLKKPESDNIDLLNVAATREQAETVFFSIFKNFVMKWKWLRNKYDIQVSGRYFGTATEKNLNSGDVVVITNDSIVFPHNIRAFSGSSEGENLEGKNLLFFALDEVDAFKCNSVTRNAEKIYRILRTSAFSRYKSRYKSFILSYPRSNDGFILKMYEKYKGSLNVYTDRAATWEVLPEAEHSKDTFEFQGLKIPMDYYEEFATDPIGSLRMYACVAPTSESAYIDEPTKIDEAMSGPSAPPLYEFRDYVHNDNDGAGDLRAKKILRSPYTLDRNRKHIVVIDLGIKRDPTALSIMHKEENKIVLDLVTRWIPDEKNKIKVDLNNVEEVITSIFKTLNVECLYADHWNSPLLIARLRKTTGKRGEVVKVEQDDYETFKRLLYSGFISLPKNSALAEELKGLQVFSSGKVDHVDGAHDDMAMTVVMGVKMLTKLGKSVEDGANLSVEGEFVGDNLGDTKFTGDFFVESKKDGIQIDGMPM